MMDKAVIMPEQVRGLYNIKKMYVSHFYEDASFISSLEKDFDIYIYI